MAIRLLDFDAVPPEIIILDGRGDEGGRGLLPFRLLSVALFQPGCRVVRVVDNVVTRVGARSLELRDTSKPVMIIVRCEVVGRYGTRTIIGKALLLKGVEEAIGGVCVDCSLTIGCCSESRLTSVTSPG